MSYIVFAFDSYYPSGGAHDIVAIKSDKEKAFKKARNLRANKHGALFGPPDHIQVLDSETGESVEF